MTELHECPVLFELLMDMFDFFRSSCVSSENEDFENMHFCGFNVNFNCLGHNKSTKARKI